MRNFIRKLIIPLLLNTSVVHSAEWKIEPALQFNTGYNDNVRIRINNKVSSAEATLSPSAVFSMENPSSSLSGDLRFDFRRFEEDSSLDDNNVRFNTKFFHRMERSQVGIDLGLIKDTTLDSQLEETGLAFERIKRNNLKGGGEWSYSINEKTSIRSSYTYSDVQYKNAKESGFVNYNIQSGQVALNRILSERTTVSITLSQSRSDNNNGAKSTNNNLQSGASFQFSETLSASLFAGIRRTESNFSRDSRIPLYSGNTYIGFIPLTEDMSNSSTGYTFSGSLSKTFLRGETSGTASRSISSSINGLPIEVTRLSWKNLYRFSEILSVTLNFDLYNSASENSVSRRLNRSYYQISPGVTWKFKEFWRISGSYRYRKQTFDDISDDTIQNAAYLTLTYGWPRMAISR